MSNLNNIYGKYVATNKWDYFVTIRPEHKMNEFDTNKRMENLSKRRNVNRLFYSREVDRDLEMNTSHVHLLLKTNTVMTKEQVAKGLRLKEGALSYYEEVDNAEAVSMYCTKYLFTNKTRDYNFY